MELLRAGRCRFHACGSDSFVVGARRPTPSNYTRHPRSRCWLGARCTALLNAYAWTPAWSSPEPGPPTCLTKWYSGDGYVPIRTNLRSTMNSATNAAATSTDPSSLVNELLEQASPIGLPSQEPRVANQFVHQDAFGQSSPQSRSYDPTQKAVELPVYERARNGDPEAQFNLGLIYDRGDRVERDATQALKWYQEAADRGLSKSQYTLGAKHGLGRDLPKNEIESFRWIRYAANQGHTPSQWLVASFYFGKFGVFKDNVEAYKWALLAGLNSSNVSQECKNLLSVVQGLLNAKQIRHCEISASRWKVKEWDQIEPLRRDPELIETTNGPRYQLSAPILAVRKLLERWQISTAVTNRFMGFDQFEDRYVQGLLTGSEALVQGSETEDRIVNLYYIRCVLGAMFRDKAVENKWLHKPHPQLEGKSLMDLILSGPWTDLVRARAHVDWVSGRLGC